VEMSPKTDAKESRAMLADGFVRARGYWTSAARSFAFMSPEDRFTSPEDSRRGVTAFSIASFRVYSGDVAGALAWARTLPSSSLRAWALRGLSVAVFAGEESME
jgi:hypothetical protein